MALNGTRCKQIAIRSVRAMLLFYLIFVSFLQTGGLVRFFLSTLRVTWIQRSSFAQESVAMFLRTQTGFDQLDVRRMKRTPANVTEHTHQTLRQYAVQR